MGKGNRIIPDETKLEYLNWLLTPPGEREPSTKEAMAAQLGVHRGTLNNWEDSDEFMTQMRQLKSRWGARWHGDILGRLMSIVQGGSDAAAIQAAKVLLPHLDIRSEEKDEEEITTEMTAAIKKALNEQGYKTVESS